MCIESVTAPTIPIYVGIDNYYCCHRSTIVLTDLSLLILLYTVWESAIVESLV